MKKADVIHGMGTLYEEGPGKCWNWKRGKSSAGYGGVYFGKKRFYAHRVMYELFIGAVPSGMEVCHKCDNPSCVNPEHLFIGTHKDNMRDMADKGRWPILSLPGSANPSSKLKENQVMDIIAELRNGSNGAALARKYGVTRTTIGYIKHGKKWGWLTGRVPNTEVRP
jgi:hypothetical protein